MLRARPVRGIAARLRLAGITIVLAAAPETKVRLSNMILIPVPKLP